MLNQHFDDLHRPVLGRELERGFVAARVSIPDGAVRGSAAFQQERRAREVVASDRVLELVFVAVAPVGLLVLGEDGGAVVRDERCDDVEAVVNTGVLEGAVAASARK